MQTRKIWRGRLKENIRCPGCRAVATDISTTVEEGTISLGHVVGYSEHWWFVRLNDAMLMEEEMDRELDKEWRD